MIEKSLRAAEFDCPIGSLLNHRVSEWNVNHEHRGNAQPAKSDVFRGYRGQCSSEQNNFTIYIPPAAFPATLFDSSNDIN